MRIPPFAGWFCLLLSRSLPTVVHNEASTKLLIKLCTTLLMLEAHAIFPSPYFSSHFRCFFVSASLAFIFIWQVFTALSFLLPPRSPSTFILSLFTQFYNYVSRCLVDCIVFLKSESHVAPNPNISICGKPPHCESVTTTSLYLSQCHMRWWKKDYNPYSYVNIRKQLNGSINPTSVNLTET